MKYLFAAVVLQMLFLNAFSATVTSRIHSIDKGKNGQPDLIMFENGHTAFMNSAKTKSLLNEMKESLNRDETIRVKLDNKLNVLSVETISSQGRYEESLPEPLASYDPSIVTIAAASSAFKNMRRDYQNNSQCYNRAHIWTYEEFKRTSMRSGKLFLFFTSKYIRNYRYKWWFHVTPFAYVGGSSQSSWLTMDRRYTAGLLSTKTWTDVFMHNNATCPVVYKYYDYRNHQKTQDCYLIPTSMYFWQPRDIERQERTGYVKTQYINSEINHSYWEAF